MEPNSPFPPTLKACILAGGHSSRMGTDKSRVCYHGVPQELHLARLCSELGLECWISKPANFQEDYIAEFPVLRDHVPDSGPLGGIGTAMRQDPEAAWLILACDMPFLTEGLIRQLIEARDPRAGGTVAQSSQKDKPEPLVAIYEPRMFMVVMEYLSRGKLSPMKMILSLGEAFKLVPVTEPEQLQNVNTPEEMESAIQRLHGD